LVWTPLWPWSCWGESTPAEKVSSNVTSELSAQTAPSTERADGYISATRTE
jgi:hypothetical protein